MLWWRNRYAFSKEPRCKQSLILSISKRDFIKVIEGEEGREDGEEE